MAEYACVPVKIEVKNTEKTDQQNEYDRALLKIKTIKKYNQILKEELACKESEVAKERELLSVLLKEVERLRKRIDLQKNHQKRSCENPDEEEPQAKKQSVVSIVFHS